MRSKLVLFLSLAIVCRISGVAIVSEELSQFLQFKEEYGIKYETNEEEIKRFEIFKENLKEIERLNKEYPETNFGVTQFTGMTYEEFGSLYLMDKSYVRKTGKGFTQGTGKTIPDSLDWRDKKIVSHIKNQGQCGSCWTFAVNAAVESHLALKTGEHHLFSEQQLLDCVTNNYGCTGGYLDTAYQYLGYVGVTSESSYPYTAKQGNCSIPNGDLQQIQGYYDIIGNEDVLATFVAENGPASFSIMCPKEMMHYKSGIFSVPDCKATMLGYHALAIVGYTPDYWIIKNSWGEKWGEEGYVRFKRGVALCDMTQGAGGPFIM